MNVKRLVIRNTTRKLSAKLSRSAKRKILSDLWDEAQAQANQDRDMMAFSEFFQREADDIGWDVIAERTGMSIPDLREKIKRENISDLRLSEIRRISIASGIGLKFTIREIEAPRE